MFRFIVGDVLRDWIWIPAELQNEALSLPEWIQIFTRFGYLTITTLSMMFFGLRFTLGIFHYFQARSKYFVKSQISADQAADGGTSEIITSVVGLGLIFAGMLLIRVVLHFFFPQYLWMFRF